MKEKRRQRRNSKANQVRSTPADCSNIAHITEDKLAQTMAEQQKVLLEQTLTSTTERVNKLQVNENSDSSKFEWVVKRRSDGTRYIARRPIKTRLLHDRKQTLENERRGMTTDDDAVSELKTGRHWSKEDRKRHVQRARQHQHYKKLLQQKLEMMKTSTKDEQSHLLELSHKKYQRHAMRDLNFLTVQEMLAHRMRLPATTSNILSVTTV